jgi:NitT/TauT family transport system ATP-binding protein
MAPVMEIRIDEKSFPAVAEAASRPVLAGIGLKIPGGQVCVISGPSGSGKSTLLSIVAGLDRDFRGEIADRPSPLGFMFQTPRLLPWATAKCNVELAIPGREADAARWLEAVGLAGFENTYPERLSLGMARRVNLARALAVRPALLLLDEPFASLDAATAGTVQNLLRTQIAARDMTVLLVTHDLSLAAPLADRLVVLDGVPARILRDLSVPRPKAEKRSMP